MSSKVPIGYIDIRVFAHATEEVDKVLSAVYHVLPSELKGIVSLKKTGLAGHHGNPIILFEARIKEKDASQAVFKKLIADLSMLDKELLSGEVGQHLEKGNLYIRLDKQSAYLDKIRLSSVDPIHLRFHFNKPSREVIDVCKQHGLLP